MADTGIFVDSFYKLGYRHLRLLDCSWQAGDTLLTRQEALRLLDLTAYQTRSVCIACSRHWARAEPSAPVAWVKRFCDSKMDESARALARSEIDRWFQSISPDH